MQPSHSSKAPWNSTGTAPRSQEPGKVSPCSEGEGVCESFTSRPASVHPSRLTCCQGQAEAEGDGIHGCNLRLVKSIVSTVRGEGVHSMRQPSPAVRVEWFVGSSGRVSSQQAALQDSAATPAGRGRGWCG